MTRVWKIGCAAVLLIMVGCSHPSRLETIPNFAPVEGNPSLVPQPRGEGNWWDPRHAQILERVRQGDVGMVLLGDSITHRLERQPELWDRYFVPRKAVNMGFDGDSTQQVLWRIQHGCLDGIEPKLAMVLIGSNQVGEGYSAEQVADGIIAVCRAVRDKLPHTKILLLAVLPREEFPNPGRAKLARASALASQVADGKTIVYLDINDRLFSPGETISKEIMGDYVHPTRKGYELMLEAVDPTISKMLAE